MKINNRIFKDRDGASAVEFAIIAPLFIMTLLTFIGFGIYLATANAVQQIAADAARTAIAGLDAAERDKLARDFIAKSTFDYFMLEPSRLATKVMDDPRNLDQFTVSVEYDAANLPIWSLYSFVMPTNHIKRFSTIRIGGI
jgi:Flp pilus assembly protein TadG